MQLIDGNVEEIQYALEILNKLNWVEVLVPDLHKITSNKLDLTKHFKEELKNKLLQMLNVLN